MPTQRFHGGAALQPINLVAPGFLGLNSERENSILGPEWATSLNNAVLDDAGRIAVRKGWLNVSQTFSGKSIAQIHEYRDSTGDSDILCVMSDGSVYRDMLGTPTLIAAAATISDTNCDIANLKDLSVFFDGGTLYSWDGTSWATISTTGTAPDGHIGIAAYGRLWGVDNNRKVIRYTDILDETAWNGVIDMTSVWPDGQDSIRGLRELGGDLIIFGERQIVVWTDGRGATLGIDPSSLYVSDTIVGFGLEGKRAIARVDGDLWFVSKRGVISIGRLLQSRSSELAYITANVESGFSGRVAAETDKDRIALVYSPLEHICVAHGPTLRTQLCFDTRIDVPAGSQNGYAKFASQWTAPLDYLYATDDGNLYASLVDDTETVVTDKLFRYSGFDDNEEDYTFTYQSGWLDLGEASDYEKMLKKMVGTIFIQANTAINYNWGYDFASGTFSESVEIPGSGTAAEWGVAEWGVDEWGGGAVLREVTVNTRGRGQYIRVGLEIDTGGAQFALQQLKLLAKIGRLSS